MANQNSSPRSEYEHLKRKNRRRLLGAIVLLVIVAVLLLINVFHKNSNETEVAQIVTVNGEDTTEDADNNVISTIESEEPIASQSSEESPTDQINDSGEINTSIDSESSKEQESSGNNGNLVESDDFNQSITESNAAKNNYINQPSLSVTTPKKSNGSSASQVSKSTPKEQNNSKTITNKNTGDKKNTQSASSSSVAKIPSKDKQANSNVSQSSKVDTKDPLAILEGRANLSSTKPVIQVGAFSSQAQAEQTKKKLNDIGISSQINEVNTSKGKIYRVRTSTFDSQATAKQALTKIHKNGLDGIVIGQ